MKSIIWVGKLWETGGRQAVPFKLKLCYAITGTEVTGKILQVAKSLRLVMIGFQTERKLLPHGVTFYPVPVTQVAISSTRVAVLGKKMRYYFSPRSATIKAPRKNQPRKTMKQVNITVTTYGAPDAASLKQDERSVLFAALLERIGELNKEGQQNVSSSKNIL